MLITNQRPVSWYFIYKTIGGIPKRILLSPGQQIEVPEIEDESQIVFKAYDRKVREINNRLERGVVENIITPDRKVFVDRLRGIDSYIDLTRFLSDRISFISESVERPVLTTLYSKTTNLSVGTQLYVKDNIYETGNFYRLGQIFTVTNERGDEKEINSWAFSNSLEGIPLEGSSITIFSKDELTSYTIDFTKGVITEVRKKSDKDPEKPKPEPVSHISQFGTYNIYVANAGQQNIFVPMERNIALDGVVSLTLDSYNIDDNSILSNISLVPSVEEGLFSFRGSLTIDEIEIGRLSVASTFDENSSWTANNVEVDGNFYDIKIQLSAAKVRR